MSVQGYVRVEVGEEVGRGKLIATLKEVSEYQVTVGGNRKEGRWIELSCKREDAEGVEAALERVRKVLTGEGFEQSVEDGEVVFRRLSDGR